MPVGVKNLVGDPQLPSHCSLTYVVTDVNIDVAVIIVVVVGDEVSEVLVAMEDSPGDEESGVVDAVVVAKDDKVVEVGKVVVTVDVIIGNEVRTVVAMREISGDEDEETVVVAVERSVVTLVIWLVDVALVLNGIVGEMPPEVVSVVSSVEDNDDIPIDDFVVSNDAFVCITPESCVEGVLVGEDGLPLDGGVVNV